MKRPLLLLALAVALPTGLARAEEGITLPPVTDAAVTKECGACHMVFPPQFLPARSWRKLTAELSSHFGEDASLADPVRETVTAYLVANAADAPATSGGKAFLRGLAGDATPLRISETPWWKAAHEEVTAAQLAAPKVKSAANCVACHTTAAEGVFAEPEEFE